MTKFEVRLSFLLLVVAFISLLSFTVGIVTTRYVFPYVVDTVAPGRLYEAVSPFNIPTLQQIAADAVTDAEALARVTDYFAANRVPLTDMFHETNPVRLAGLFSMYVTHISHAYGSLDDPGSFLGYLNARYADCGDYAHYQRQILDALGIPSRLAEIGGGTHAWIEVWVDDHWEIFDATTNIWVDHSSIELVQGDDRRYRTFYTPSLDANRPDMQNTTTADLHRLRLMMPGLGLYYRPLAFITVEGEPQVWAGGVPALSLNN